jgi:hypothetical protein
MKGRNYSSFAFSSLCTRVNFIGVYESPYSRFDTFILWLWRSSEKVLHLPAINMLRLAGGKI